MPNTTTIRVLALDIYGTILNTSSITSGIKQHVDISAEKAGQLSQLWRRYQLEYTWRLNSMGLYEPFDVVTRNSLKHAAAELQVKLSDDNIAALMDAYNQLVPFEDAVPALTELKRIPVVELIIFSNGTTEMVSTALHSSLPESLLPIPLHLVDSVKMYKPASVVYQSLLERVREAPETKRDAPDVWLVSGNPFDVTGARAAGLGAFWVDRSGKGWTDQLPLPENIGPMRIVRDLGEVVEIVRASQ
ncbi:haloacid dehalogenase [Laetiporus sulphureus 93-53]|uniref:Haloacid dehalogenase n=1 Tax=Laetiporus sulphureus 93-53 TaxID=1314785 RepID=A0A165CX82_9APHY|nr:haloacid dehalogenase [Laetiporus sulphureus 93-53]KZT03644.1 haloacid dehalogenase [Laetiporus sulphureus 93-53]